MPDEGPRNNAVLLRLPRRALGSFEDDEPHRKRVCDSSAQNGAHKRFVVIHNRKTDGIKLIIAASKTWRRLQGENQLPKVIGGVRFQDGIEVIEVPANHAA